MTLAERPDFSGFVPFPEEALKGSITARFESIAARFAEQIAVSDEHAALTYSAVFAMAQSIANAIGGLPPGQIGILLRNERRYIPAMLGVLAAGRVFVPLNAEHPAERNQQILTFAGAVAVISAGIPSFGQWPVIDLDQPLPPARNFVAVPASPEDLAYIPFTSGSTGQPKGMRRHHQSLLHYALQTTNTMRICPADRLATFNSASVTEGLIITFCAILNGASVHCLPIADRPPAALLATLRKHGVTLLWSVPRLFRHLIEPFAWSRWRATGSIGPISTRCVAVARRKHRSVSGSARPRAASMRNGSSTNPSAIPSHAPRSAVPRTVSA